MANESGDMKLLGNFNKPIKFVSVNPPTSVVDNTGVERAKDGLAL